MVCCKADVWNLRGSDFQFWGLQEWSENRQTLVINITPELETLSPRHSIDSRPYATYYSSNESSFFF